MEETIGVYLRLSREDIDRKAKDDSSSIAAQRRIIQRYLDGEPSLAGLPRMEFCDDGFSGTNFDRPGFARMTEQIREGRITCVIVKDLSRFGRDYLEVGDYLEHIFPFLGVRMISVNDHYDSADYRGITGGMDVAFRNLIYDYYSKDLSKKVKTGMRMRQRHGGYVSCCLYGYQVLPGQKHQMVVDPEAASVVRRVFREVIAGKTTVQIARELNAEHIPTPLEYKTITRRPGGTEPEKKAFWTHYRIHEMIRNPKYTGCMVNHTRESRHIRDKNLRKTPREEWIITENAHEALVSREDFALAQEAIHRRRFCGRKETAESVPLYCAHCGRRLRKTTGRDERYYCATPYQTGADEACKKVRWDRKNMEKVVLESLKAELQVMEVRIRTAQKEAPAGGAALAKQRKELQEELKNSDSRKIQDYLDYREERITKEDFIALRERREKRRAELERQAAETEAAYEEYQAFVKQNQDSQKILDRTDTRSDEELKKRMYDAVERVMVSDEKHIGIVWKFEDAFRP